MPNRREQVLQRPVAHGADGISQRAHRASGQPISRLMHQALAHPDLISLAAGFVDQQTLPLEPTRKALDRLWSDPAGARAALQYGTTQGYPPLREALLADLRKADGGGQPDVSVDQVVVTAGSNQLLHLLADTLLDPGDIVLCTAPSYFVYLGMLRSLGVRSVGVVSDEKGMVPEALEDSLRAIEAAGELARVKAIYLVSYFDNPRGVTLAAERRGPVVEIAKRWSMAGKIYVIDDAAYRELRYEGPDLPSLLAHDAERDTVILAQTFSKCYSPGIRLGYGVLPRQLVQPVLDQKGNADFGSPNFNQHLVAALLEQNLLAPHVEQLRSNYRSKLAAMLEAAEQFLSPLPGVRWLRPAGGLYVWLELPPELPAGPGGGLVERALAEGVLYVPGEYCYPEEGAAIEANTIRLSFGVQSRERIRLGIEALARAIRNCLE
ncbi:MAG: PLP-dependent aminotransferase family protein [Pirellulales bacterium]